MSAMVDLGLGVSSIHNLLPELGAISERFVEAGVDSDVDRLIGEFSGASVDPGASASSDTMRKARRNDSD
jgi:hypothetical protein